MSTSRFSFLTISNSENRIFSAKLFFALCVPLALSACGGGGGSGDAEPAATQTLSQDTPFLFVERSIGASASKSLAVYQENLMDYDSTPLDVNSPYAFNPGAKLIHRSSIDVNAQQWAVLENYFGSSRFDVKDLSISVDGKKVLFAARGPEDHPYDYTWNVYEYEFETRSIRRIISDSLIANGGHDTNPTYADDGRIVFSSDRAAGNPNWDEQLTEAQLDADCYKIGPAERPSLLHIMSAAGDNIIQLTFGNNHDTKTATLTDGRVAFMRSSRSYELIEQCDDLETFGTGELQLSHSNIFPHSNASGLSSPEPWTYERLCSYTVETPFGQALPSNHYTLLTINPDSEQLEQLYETVTQFGSDAEFVSLDRIVQGADGYLVGLMKHFYNQHQGGTVVTLQAPSNATNSLFGNVAPRSLVSDRVDLYPNQLSLGGWYSAVVPYRDGTDRLLVSWSNCATENNGVNAFCTQGEAGEVNTQYGIWVYEPRTDSRLPIVRAKPDVVYTDLAIAQNRQGLDLPFAPVNGNYVDNTDESRIICDDPSNIEPTDPADPVDPQDPTDPSNPGDPQDPNNPGAPTDPANPGEPTDPVDPVDPPAPPVVNQLPVANAGNDQTLNLNSVALLNGSGSSDPDTQPQQLMFTWEFMSIPSNSALNNAAIDSADSTAPSFVPDVLGDFILRLTVSDGAATDSDEVTVTISNLVPLANAGADQVTTVRATVFLDGSASSDPDGQPQALTYHWTFSALPMASQLSDANIINADSATPSFIPDVSGNYTVQLSVSDGGGSDTDAVEVATNNQGPVADAGMDENVVAAQAVMLDSSASFDPDSDTLSYWWTLTDVPPDSLLTNADIVGRDTPNPSFVPDAGLELPMKADFVFVIDGSFSMDEEIAQVRQGLTAFVQALSDPENQVDARFAVVTFEERPIGSSIPVVKLAFTASTTVDDVADDVIAAFDAIDTSSLGGQQREAGLEAIRYVLGDTSLTGAPLAGLEFRNDARLNIILATDEDSDGPYSGGAYEPPDDITDGSVWQDEIDATAALVIANNAFVDLLVEPRSDVSPGGGVNTTTDQYGDPAADRTAADSDRFDKAATLAALEDPVSGHPNSLQAQVLRAGLIARSYPVTEATDAVFVNSFFNSKVEETIDNPLLGNYVFSLVVSDGEFNSDADTVTVRAFTNTTPPNALAGKDQTALLSATVNLNGSASNDTDNAPNPLSYQWRFVSVAAGSALVDGDIVNATSPLASFTPDVIGDFELELEVADGAVGNRDSDRVIITVLDIDTAPNTFAGDNKNPGACATVNVSGSNSFDPDDAPSPLSYRWSFVSLPAGSTLLSSDIQNRNSVNAAFEPDRYGSYVLELQLDDGQFYRFDHVLADVGSDPNLDGQACQ